MMLVADWMCTYLVKWNDDEIEDEEKWWAKDTQILFLIKRKIMVFIDEKYRQENKICEKIPGYHLNLFSCWEIYQKFFNVLEAHA